LTQRDKRSSKAKTPDKLLKISVSFEFFVVELPILDSGIHQAVWFSGPLLDLSCFIQIQPMPDGIFQDLLISVKLVQAISVYRL